MINKSRALYIFKYLWDHTDEEHPATTADIIQYLASIGISTTRKTVAEDAAELQNSGFDVICNRSRQNEYFIGSRHLELAELKLLVDAVQAAKFISPKKSKELIGKVTELEAPIRAIRSNAVSLWTARSKPATSPSIMLWTRSTKRSRSKKR